MSQLEVFESIAKEIKIDDKGRVTVTIRGAARIVDIKHPTLVRQFEGCTQNPSKLAEKLINAGFEGGTLERFSETGIPDTALSIIIQYYAMDAGRYCTELAKAVLSAFLAVGLRSYLQESVGWQKEEPQTQVATPDTKALPYPGVTLRVRIIRAVDNYVHLFKANHQQVWAAIYRDLKHTFKYDVKAALKAADVKGRSKLEQIEIDNKLEELRSVAQVVLQTEI